MSKSIMDYFPLKGFEIRPAQRQVLDFIERMISDYDCRDIIIQAPTGAGKSAVGATCCNWAADWPEQVTDEGKITKPGGYYLVTQKALQTQIINDVHTNFKNRDFGSIWSASNYPCDGGKIDANAISKAQMVFAGLKTEEERAVFMLKAKADTGVNCQVGMKTKKAVCHGRQNNCCPYAAAKQTFMNARFSLTNYAYFLTEKMFVGKMPPRQLLVLDECHTIEKQLLSFGEVVLSDSLLKEWSVRSTGVPELDDKYSFAKWLDTYLIPLIRNTLQDAEDRMQAEEDSDTLASRITTLQNYLQKMEACVSGIQNNPPDWVYWYEQTEKDGNIAYCKPLEAAPYMDMIRAGGLYRVYMSAFPGDKATFCNSLGLDIDAVAMIKLKSDFPKENRPVFMSLVGSMSRKNQQTTIPAMLRVVDKIMTMHAETKGIIHCHSYELGQKIETFIKSTAHGSRLLFPKNATERDEAYRKHQASTEPTILLSPSMTEGFDFKFDQARWQIIAKMPFPYLGDKQIAAKKDRSQSWYDAEVVKTIVQTAGRVCRDEKDEGKTYILDSDMRMLWDKCENTFPDWFREAVHWL